VPLSELASKLDSENAGCAGGFVTTKNPIFPEFHAREKIYPPLLQKKHHPPEIVFSNLQLRGLQLDAGVGGCELLAGFGVVLVAVVLPCGDFVGEGLLVVDAAIQTLRRENGEFGFGHVEPTAVLGSVMPFEPLDEPAGLGRGKGLIERGWFVDVEIILQIFAASGIFGFGMRTVNSYAGGRSNPGAGRDPDQRDDERFECSILWDGKDAKIVRGRSIRPLRSENSHDTPK
jgi:hypothetical protein